MASFDEEFQLTDEDREVIAKDVADMDDETFAAYGEKMKVLLKDKNKKWSAKRTISGVLVYVIADYLQHNDLSWMVVSFTLVAVLPLCLSFFETKCCSNCKTNK